MDVVLPRGAHLQQRQSVGVVAWETRLVQEMLLAARRAATEEPRGELSIIVASVGATNRGKAINLVKEDDTGLELLRLLK